MRTLLSAFLLLSLSALASAQSLAQVSIEGRLAKPSRVEVEIGAMVANLERQLDFHTFLAAGTTAQDVMGLIAGRLEASGFHAHLGPVRENSVGGRTLFVERALFIRMRIGDGLVGSITACEASPTSVRVVPHAKNSFTLTATAGLYNPGADTHSTDTMSLEFKPGTFSAQCVDRLLEEAARKGWASNRPAHELWQPVKLVTGEQITGMTFNASASWRVEVDLRRAEEE